MDFFGQQYTFTVSGSFLLVVSISLFLVIGGSLFYGISKARQLRLEREPKFGFLGKRLYPVVALALLMGSLVYFNYAAPGTGVVNIQAAKEVSVEIDYETVNQAGINKNIKFQAFPKVDGVEWAGEGESFDLIWNIKGPKNYSKVELDLNSQNTGGFTTTLQSGSYTLDLTVVYQGGSYKFTENFSI